MPYNEMKEIKIIKSLHRPFNTRLMTCKWVCRFAKDYNGFNFKNDFFLYLVKFLYTHYLNEKNNIYGLPAKDTITVLYEYISSHNNIEDDIARFNNPSKKNQTEIDKKLFSNLKAALYYITLSKNLGLIGSKNKLTNYGYLLGSMRQSSKRFTILTSKEKLFLFDRILCHDFVPIIFGISYYRLKKIYNPTDRELDETDLSFLKLLDDFLEIREFKYKQSSWRNYIKVRESWIEDLEALSQSHYGLKPSYFRRIKSNDNMYNTYLKINDMVLRFEKDSFKTLAKYRDFKINLYKSYMKIKVKKVFRNIGYVNLYDIKKDLNISFGELEIMLNRLTKDEYNRRKVFFNNIISAIDSRKRFKIRNSAVLNIRITGVIK